MSLNNAVKYFISQVKESGMFYRIPTIKNWEDLDREVSLFKTNLNAYLKKQKFKISVFKNMKSNDSLISLVKKNREILNKFNLNDEVEKTKELVFEMESFEDMKNHGHRPYGGLNKITVSGPKDSRVKSHDFIIEDKTDCTNKYSAITTSESVRKSLDKIFVDEEVVIDDKFSEFRDRDNGFKNFEKKNQDVKNQDSLNKGSVSSQSQSFTEQEDAYLSSVIGPMSGELINYSLQRNLCEPDKVYVYNSRTKNLSLKLDDDGPLGNEDYAYLLGIYDELGSGLSGYRSIESKDYELGAKYSEGCNVGRKI